MAEKLTAFKAKLSRLLTLYKKALGIEDPEPEQIIFHKDEEDDAGKYEQKKKDVDAKGLLVALQMEFQRHIASRNHQLYVLEQMNNRSNEDKTKAFHKLYNKQYDLWESADKEVRKVKKYKKLFEAKPTLKKYLKNYKYGVSEHIYTKMMKKHNLKP